MKLSQSTVIIVSLQQLSLACFQSLNPLTVNAFSGLPQPILDPKTDMESSRQSPVSPSTLTTSTVDTKWD